MHRSHRLPSFLALLGAAALTVSGCGSSAPRSAAPGKAAGMISIFETDQLLSTPAATLEQLRRLGVQYVRVLVRWRSIAPAPGSPLAPAHFDASSPAAYPAAGWSPYDAIDRDAHALHMGVLFDLTGGAPDWAMGAGAPRQYFAPGAWRPSAAGFGQFTRAVGSRYSGTYTPAGSGSPLPRISFWSIWNEPNLGEADLAPQTTDGSRIEASARMYRQLLDAAWNGLQRSGHGGDTILIGELAPYGLSVPNLYPGTFGYMEPLRFLRALYCVNGSLRPLGGAQAAARGCPITAAGSRAFARRHPALFRATGFAIHPYPSGGVAPDKILSVDDPDFVYLAAIARLTRFLDRVTARYGAPRRYPIYVTEYGYRTTPPLRGGVPLALAPAYENWAEYLAWRNPRLRSWDHYLLSDPPASADSRFVSGLEYADGVPKPTYAAYRLPIYLPATAQHRGGLEVWGCVRPAYYYPLPHRVQIQLQPGGEQAFRTIRTVTLTAPSCYFDVTVRFPSGGNVRLAWSYPRGPAVYSRLVAITTG